MLIESLMECPTASVSSMSGAEIPYRARSKRIRRYRNNGNAQAHGARRSIGEIVMVAGQVVDLRASGDEPQQLLGEPRNIQQLYFARVDPGFERFVDLRLRKHR